jgi:hypothetical protein
MKVINVKWFFLFVLLLVSCLDINASAGNDAVSKGINLSLWIIAVCILLAVIGFFLLSRLKNTTPISLVQPTATVDWDYNSLVDYVKSTFRQMQCASTNLDIDSVSELLTPVLCKHYEDVFYAMFAKCQKEVVLSVVIHEVSILGHDNANTPVRGNRFSAVITGERIVYTLNEKMRQVVKNPRRESEPFSYTYTFVKHDAKWLLDVVEGGRVEVTDMPEEKMAFRSN